MSPQSILVGQIIIVFATVIFGVWFATQWVAAALFHDPYLGRPWFIVFGQNVYYPWRLFEWWFAFGPYAPATFTKGGVIAASSGVVATFFAIIASVWRGRVARHLTTYGSSRWAGDKDISAAEMFKPKGVFLGQFDDRYLRHDGPEHVLTFAPTRSGKGVGLVVRAGLLGAPRWSAAPRAVQSVVEDVRALAARLNAAFGLRNLCLCAPMISSSVRRG